MPVVVRVVDHDQRSLRVEVTEAVDVTQVTAFQDGSATAGTWGYAALIVIDTIAWIPTSDEMRLVLGNLQQHAASLGRRGPVALVTAQDAVFGMARVYASLNANRFGALEVFRKEAVAVEWLSSQLTAGSPAG